MSRAIVLSEAQLGWLCMAARMAVKKEIRNAEKRGGAWPGSSMEARLILGGEVMEILRRAAPHEEEGS